MDPRPRTPLLAVAPTDRADSGGSADSVMSWPRSGDELADQIDHAVEVSIGLPSRPGQGSRNRTRPTFIPPRRGICLGHDVTLRPSLNDARLLTRHAEDA